MGKNIEDTMEQYEVTIFLKVMNGEIEKFTKTIVEHNVDHKNKVFTYTDSLLRLGLIPLENIQRIVFEPELFKLRYAQNKTSQSQNSPKQNM